MPTPKNLLKSYEEQFDKDIKSLSILQAPIRVALSALYEVIDCLFHGTRFPNQGDAPPLPDKGNAVLSRLSYLVPLLLQCPVEPIGRDALNVYNYIRNNPDLYFDVKELLEYAHFSEIMPEVHRGYFEVTGNREEGFILSHKDENIPVFEACDIKLTELALPIGLRPRAIPKDLCNAIARSDSFDLRFLIKMFFIRFHELLPLVVEPPVLTEEGFQAAIGTGVDGFHRFRAAWFAIADCSLAPFSLIKLIHQGDKLILAFPPADFVGADCGDPAEITMFEPPCDRHFHRAEDAVPTGFEDFSHFLPTQPFAPSGQKPGIGHREMTFARRPWQSFDIYATGWALHPPWSIEEENRYAPEGNKGKAPDAQGVITGSSLAALGTDGLAAGLRPQRYHQSRRSGISPCAGVVDKTRLFFDTVQDSLYVHPVWPTLRSSLEETFPGKVRQDALYENPTVGQYWQ